MLPIDLSTHDAATFRRATALHKKKLQMAIAAVAVVERSDADLRNQASQLVFVVKQLEDVKEEFVKRHPGELVTTQLENPRRLVLCTSLHILRRAIDTYLEKGFELLGAESQTARREKEHVEALLGRLDDQTALELGYVDDKPVEISKEGIADVRAATQKGIDEGDTEVVSPKGNKWDRRNKRGKENHLRAAAAPAKPEKQSTKKRERGVVKEQKKRERDVLDENRP